MLYGSTLFLNLKKYPITNEITITITPMKITGVQNPELATLILNIAPYKIHIQFLQQLKPLLINKNQSK